MDITLVMPTMDTMDTHMPTMDMLTMARDLLMPSQRPMLMLSMDTMVMCPPRLCPPWIRILRIPICPPWIGYYGKRSADAEPKADADALYGYYGYGLRPYAHHGYYGYPYAHHGYAYYGKRSADAEADADAYYGYPYAYGYGYAHRGYYGYPYAYGWGK